MIELLLDKSEVWWLDACETPQQLKINFKDDSSVLSELHVLDCKTGGRGRNLLQSTAILMSFSTVDLYLYDCGCMQDKIS